MLIPTLKAELGWLGLRLCGGLYPDPDDTHAAGAGTLLLVGNAGTGMWAAFNRDCLPATRAGVADPLDGWIRRTVGTIARTAGARAIFSADGPPFAPFQRWAMRAEPVYPSPLGVLIHPTFGLWHAYRAALALPGVLTLPPLPPIPHPCTSCHEKPCLAACPVAALGPDGYDVPHCAAHVRAAAGRPCRGFGCAARRACPVGQSYRYPPDQAAFHMRGFLARLPAADGTERATGAE